MRDAIVVGLALVIGLAVAAAVYTLAGSTSLAGGLGVIAAYFAWGEIGDRAGSSRDVPPPAPGQPLLANAKLRRRLLGLAAVGGASAVIVLQLLTGDIEVDGVRDWIRDLGAWGPILLISVLAAAMIVAPIPNPPFMIAAGIAWGTFLGVVYSVIGQLLGSMVIYAISRRYGRQFIPKLIGESGAARVDMLAKDMGPQVVFWWRMMPVAFDFAAYAAGLTGMSFRLFVTLVFIGSIIPTTVVVGFGDSFGKSVEAQVVTLGMVAIAMAIPATIFYLRYRDQLPPMREWPGHVLRMLAPTAAARPDA